MKCVMLPRFTGKWVQQHVFTRIAHLKPTDDVPEPKPPNESFRFSCVTKTSVTFHPHNMSEQCFQKGQNGPESAQFG